ncbi:MAG TPA: sigma-70 family RNA polymerase sigma factor [Polyangiaceae bacterium]|nr:sigma-70 family RNA polymerase sigma factor [Polyangiaceae bacterium]
MATTHGSPSEAPSTAAAAASRAALGEANDATLAVELIAKNRDAPRVAWSRFSPLVRRILRRSLGPQHDVEDIVQDVFLCLFQRVHTLRDPVALKAFVIAITVRTVRYEIRRAKVRRWVGLSRSAELLDLRVVNADTSARHALIHFYRALDRINQRDRTAFVLRFIEGMEAAEVAAALDVSVPTARRCFTRAWERVTFFAKRDPFLVDYLNELEVTSLEDSP